MDQHNRDVNVREKSIEISELLMDDYEALIELWKKTEGVSLSQADEPENIRRFLKRNPGLSFVARHNDRVVGAVLAGHDGRRGYLHHLAVANEYRNHGIGRILVDTALSRLQAEGITKCHVFVYRDNTHGQAFWQAVGWERRDQLVLCSTFL